jgi:hypothetical protein
VNPEDLSNADCLKIWRCIEPDDTDTDDLEPVFDFLRSWLASDATVPALECLVILLSDNHNLELALQVDVLARARRSRN